MSVAPAWLPADASERQALHEELHARPPARIRLPALVVYVAVLNQGVSREQEWAHLCQLPGQQALSPSALNANFLRLRLRPQPGGPTLKWERHNEFTRYSLLQALPADAGLGAAEPDLLRELALPSQWLQGIPGRTIVALQLALVECELDSAGGSAEALKAAQTWFGPQPLVASLLGSGHSLAVTDFHLRPCGFSRLLVLSDRAGSEMRAGRLAQRLLELETYRMMALLALPVAKALAPLLSDCEQALAALTADLQNGELGAEAEQLDALIALAARVEHATAAHGYRFAATKAYDGLVSQRLRELGERNLPGTQTLGGFLQRRFSPAVATVDSSAQRLNALAQRIERCSALLRTRVNITAEGQQQHLLLQLTRGQDLQLKLQSTVEGLSIAAISYYVISLLGYAAKALKSAGLPLNLDITTGLLIPLVLAGVWHLSRRIHHRLMPRG